MLALNNQGRILLNKNTPAPKKIASPDLFQPLYAGAATVSAGHAHWGAVMDTGEVLFLQKTWHLFEHCTHVVSIFIGDSCSIKQNLIKLQSQKYCHFMRLTTKFIFLHD